MAKDAELELDPSGGKGGKGKLIIIIVVVVLLVAGSVVGAMMFMGGGSDDAAETDEAADEKELVVKPVFYFDMAPAFVVNFENPTHATYLQVEIQLMSRDKAAVDMAQQELPRMRDRFLDVLSAQKYEEVSTREGKKKLQEELLVVAQEIVGEAMKVTLESESETEVKPEDIPNIEAVYFTGFIMQ